MLVVCLHTAEYNSRGKVSQREFLREAASPKSRLFRAILAGNVRSRITVMSRFSRFQLFLLASQFCLSPRHPLGFPL